jgi:hypothetical protein
LSATLPILPPDERAELFDIAAANMKIPAGLIEKDFWVCYILRKTREEE